MSTPLSIRFDAALLSRLRRRAASTTGSSVSALAQRLIDEGLRMADHPGVIFKDGPSGHQAALAFGPDIWEIVKFLREVDERGPAALDAAAEVLAVDADRIAAAVSYYGDHRDEVDAEIADADEASARAEDAWRARQGPHCMSPATGAPLALDEMFSPAIAVALRDLGHDVIAVAERPELRAMTDDAVFAWAAGQGRWLVTENVKDFRPILLQALQAGTPILGLVFTTSRAFPR